MANSQIENDIESLKSFELNEDDSTCEQVIDSSDMKAKLLHHLVDVSKVVQKRAGDRESDELLKANHKLVNELLNAPTKPVENVLEKPSTALNEMLTQKLAGVELDLANERVKEFVNEQLDKLVLGATMFKSINQSESKFTFVVDAVYPNENDPDYGLDGEEKTRKTIYLRGLAFDVSMYKNVAYMGMAPLYINCKKIAKNMSCKVKIEATIKNQAGKKDWYRSFTMFFGENPKRLRYYGLLNKTIESLIEMSEYEDESLGLLKDGKLEIELSFKADELVEVKEPVETNAEANAETKTEAKTETDAETTNEAKNEAKTEENTEEKTEAKNEADTKTKNEANA